MKQQYKISCDKNNSEWENAIREEFEKVSEEDGGYMINADATNTEEKIENFFQKQAEENGKPFLVLVKKNGKYTGEYMMSEGDGIFKHETGLSVSKIEAIKDQYNSLRNSSQTSLNPR